MGLRRGGESGKRATVHLGDHEYVCLQNSGAFHTAVCDSCKAEINPILLNHCKQEYLATHLPEGLDAGLNKVLHTVNETASGPELFSFPKTKCW